MKRPTLRHLEHDRMTEATCWTGRIITCIVLTITALFPTQPEVKENRRDKSPLKKKPTHYNFAELMLIPSLPNLIS